MWSDDHPLTADGALARRTLQVGARGQGFPFLCECVRWLHSVDVLPCVRADSFHVRLVVTVSYLAVLKSPRSTQAVTAVVRGLVLGGAVLLANGAHAAAILFVDDDKGQTGNAAWLSALSTLGHNVTYEAISADGQPVSNLSAYDAVVWSNGDAAYTNLTAANVSLLTAYLNGGGRLMYGGGHSLYDESPSAQFAQNYLGVSSYQYNMPMFNSCSGAATATGSMGPLSMTCSATGQYSNMLTAFAVTGANASELLALGTGFNNYNTNSDAIAALNVGNGYRALTLGFDINHVAQADRARFVGSAMNSLLGNQVPEPATMSLLALTFGALVATQRRRRG
jgi:PEP-CTERM motif